MAFFTQINDIYIFYETIKVRNMSGVIFHQAAVEHGVQEGSPGV